MSKKNDDLDRETKIADMNIEGMPWHVKSFADRFRGAGNKPESAQNMHTGDRNMPPLSGRETWSLILNAVAAALLIGLIFLGAVLLFILFCVYVWFR